MRLLALPLLVLASLLATEARADDAKGSATRPARGRHLDLAMDRYRHDFGFVPQHAERTTTFTYTNRSDKAVTGISTRGECGCNDVSVSHKELAPGAQGTLTVKFSTHTLGGRLRKRIKLTSGDPRRGEVVIELDIRIQAGLVVRPGGVAFREFKQAERPTKSFYLRWYEGHGTPFKVNSVVIPGYEDTFTTSIKPWKDAKDPKWQGWQIDVTLIKALALGNFSGEVRVRTTDKQRPELTLSLNGNVVGLLWVQARSFSFGTVRLPQGKKEKTSSLKLKPYEKGVALKNPRAVSLKGKVIVEVIPDPYMHKQGMWKLIARVAPSAPAGSLADEVIELHTGVPGEEIVRFNVRGEVRRPDPEGASDGR